METDKTDELKKGYLRHLISIKIDKFNNKISKIMKKFTFSLVTLLLCCVNMIAQQRSESEAIQIAQAFFGKQGKSPLLSVVPTQKVNSQVRKKVASARRAPAKNASFYVVNDDANNRFVIISADERMYQVLGYSENGSFNPDSVPEGLLEIIEGYNRTYDFLLSSDGTPQKIEKVSRKVVEPMIKTQWHQVYPYNAECPIDPRFENYADNEELYLQYGINIRGVTGCVATAMAQVMNYHKYPTCGHGFISYKTRSLNISQSMDFSTKPFDWDNMADTYVDGNYTASQKNAVARLMHVCGNSVVMDYTQGGSGAQNPDLAYALIHYFGYNPNIRHYAKNYFTSTEWKDIIHDDLENGRPIIYTGQGLQTNDDGSTAPYGHAFVLDGCNAEGLYHINWGYNGKYDGYFELVALEIDDSNFNLDQAMVCNITPQTVGETEDLFLADTYVQSDWLYNNTVDGYSNATLNNIYCYSVDANTYNKKFSGEIGIGLFDSNRNFIKSLDKNSYYANQNAFSGWKKCSFSFTFDASTFTEGSKFNIAPYAKANNSTKPTFIRTTSGVSDAYNIEVEDGKIIVKLGWLDIPIPHYDIVGGNYTASAFNFSNMREDWTIQVSQVEGTDTIWFSNIDPIAEKGAAVYGLVVNNGTQIRIPTGQNLGNNQYLYNYSSSEDIIVYVSGQDSTMTIQNTWGAVEKNTSGDNANQKELSRYSSTNLRYTISTPDIVDAPIVIINNKTLTISCPTEGSTIYYTIGGAKPNNNSIKYEGKVVLTDNRVIKAIAYKGSVSSSVTEMNDIHEFKVSTPTFINPNPNGNKIEISTPDPENATIYYTVDGSKPNRTTSSKYNPEKGVVCEGSTTITAFAVKDNWDDSEINEYVYTPIPDPDSEPDPEPTPDPVYEIAIENLAAGQLSSKIPPSSVSTVKTLWVSGKLNGSDIKLIREMATTGSLTDLNIQNSKLVSGGDPYYNTSFDSYTTKDNVIGDYMFNKCKKLITLILPNNVSLIENFAFDGCENLKSLTIPANCMEIKMMAIYNCKRLENVSLPMNLSNIDDTNFSQCPKLVGISVNSDNIYYKSDNGVLYTKNGLTLLRYPIGKSETSYTIPSGVVTIGSYAFYHSNLESIIIPSSVTTIENTAFGNCKNLAKIDIPNSVTKIGMMAFDNCSKLSTVKLSDNVSEIKMMTFSYCTSLQTFTFGKNVSEIDGTAFSGCASLKSFEVDEGNPMLSSIEGVLYTKDGKKLLKCPIALYSNSYAVPDGVEIIAEYAFQKCQNIEKFTLPESLTTIETSAFSNCSMTTILLPPTLNFIGWMAFEECDKLETFIIPDAVTEIPMMMLSGCDNLSYVYLPSGIKNVDISAFNRCKRLSTIYSDITDITSVEFKESYDGKVNAFDGIDNKCLWNVPEGSASSYTSQSWWVNTWKIASHIPSGINDTANSTYRIKWQNGTLILNTDSYGAINIYAINGSLIRHLTVKSGCEYRIELPGGMYIINNKKVLLK